MSTHEAESEPLVLEGAVAGGAVLATAAQHSPQRTLVPPLVGSRPPLVGSGQMTA